MLAIKSAAIGVAAHGTRRHAGANKAHMEPEGRAQHRSRRHRRREVKGREDDE